MEALGANKVKLTVDIPAEDFGAALQQAYIKNRSKFSIQGFRKGKAPKPVIESQYGEGIFFEDAFDIVFPDSYSKAVEECSLEPVSRPQLDVSQISKKDGVQYTAEIFVKPEVKLGEYKGVKAEQVKAENIDKKVEDEIARAADRNARWVDVQRPAQDKDKAIIDYSGSVDGELFDGGTAENQVLELGSGTFIPGFEEQIIGLSAGEEKDLTVTFPEDYRATHLAGKEAVFHIVLHEVKQKELPTINDEFAQDVSEFDTLEDYRASIRQRLEEQAQKQAQDATESNVIAAVVKNAKIDLPECMIENQIDHQLKQLEYSMMYQGIKLADYLEMTGTKIEDVRAQYRESAEHTVRTQLVIEAVMKKEGIEADGEKLEEAIAKRAEQAKKALEDYRKNISEDELAYIKENLAYDNTVHFLVENAVLNAPKKKTEKKKAGKENSSDE